MLLRHLHTLLRSTPRLSCRGFETRLSIVPLCVALLAPLSLANAQTNSEDFRETLLNAERAIMEGLSAQELGAVPEPIPVKASVAAPPLHLNAVAPAQAAKKAPKAPAVQKKVPAPAPVKPIEKAPEPIRQPSEAEMKAVALARDNEALKKELETLRGQVRQLQSELQSTRSELTVAETEVSRLSTVVDAKTRASLGRYNVPLPAARPQAPVAPPVQPPAQPAPAKPAEDVKPPSRNADMQIATVTVDKADLRVGPGKNNSPLMALRRGSRLAVEERQGEWYRVFAPNGQRAWVHSSLVSFGDGASSMNDGSAVRVKGFSQGAEEEAFRRLQKISPEKK